MDVTLIDVADLLVLREAVITVEVLQEIWARYEDGGL